MYFNGAGDVAEEQGAIETLDNTCQAPQQTSLFLVLSFTLCISYFTLMYCRGINYILYF